MNQLYGTLRVLACGLFVLIGVPAEGQVFCSPTQSTIDWICDLDATWFDSACWDGAIIPTRWDDVTINRPGSDPIVQVDAFARFCMLEIHDGLLLQTPGKMKGDWIRIGPHPATMEIHSGVRPDAAVHGAALDNRGGDLLIGDPALAGPHLHFNWNGCNPPPSE